MIQMEPKVILPDDRRKRAGALGCWITFRIRSDLKRISTGLAAALMLLFAPHAFANGLFCNVSATGVNFGAYNPLGPTATASTGSVSYQCLFGTARVSISQGASGTFAARSLSNPADPIKMLYNLYTDASHTVVFGDGTGGTQSVTGGQSVFFSTVTIQVYGLVPAFQDVAAGIFSDSLIVTLDF